MKLSTFGLILLWGFIAWFVYAMFQNGATLG